MTEQELKDYLKEYAKDYCNNSFLVDEVETIPAGVNLFINKAYEHYNRETGLKAESLSRHSISFDSELPQSIVRLLNPYRKVRFI